MKRLLIALCALALTGCGLAGLQAPAAVQSATAPLAHVRVDENALRTLWQGLDTIRAGIDVAVARGALVHNSPAALRVQAGLIAAQDSLNAASDLVEFLNDPLTTLSPTAIAEKLAAYRTKMREAATAFNEIAAALRQR